MAKTYGKVLGVAMLLAGVLGFAAGFMGSPASVPRAT